MVGYSEVILEPDMFVGQVVNPPLYCVALSETDPPLAIAACCEKTRVSVRERFRRR
jgi:hypothetical protein